MIRMGMINATSLVYAEAYVANRRAGLSALDSETQAKAACEDFFSFVDVQVVQNSFYQQMENGYVPSKQEDSEAG